MISIKKQKRNIKKKLENSIICAIKNGYIIIIFIDMKILFGILLIYLCSNQIIFQSNTQTVLSGVGQAVVNDYPYGVNIPQAPDAKWIWSNGWYGPACVNPIIIQQEFLVQSTNPIIAYMTADNNVTLQIDGTQILRGDDWQQVYSKEFSLNCGKHTFKITAYNADGGCSPQNPAGLIYAFSQDVSNNRCPKSIVFQSNTSTVLSGVGQALSAVYPYKGRIPQAPDAKWIWSKGSSGPTCVNPINIQQEFFVESTNPITAYMTADNNFTLQIDGTQILRGTDFNKIYSKEFSLNCGDKHTFKITAYNVPGDCTAKNPAGLIYAFFQDMTNNRCPKSIIFQSNTQTVLSGVGQAVVNDYPYGVNIPQAPDAKWIWSDGWYGPECVNPIIIQQEFLVQSTNPIIASMTADNSFTLQIDGTQILRGDDWQQVYSKLFSLNCGDKHTFKITAYNADGGCSPQNLAGLIYAFSQDVSNNRCPKISGLTHLKRSLYHYKQIHESSHFTRAL